MPPKKKSSKKKDILPDPNTLEDGQCNYYIGSWSHYQSIDAISDIAQNVVEKHTAADGEVMPLPTTVVLIPACSLGDPCAHYDVSVADKMHIESVPLTSMKTLDAAQTEVKEVQEEELDRDKKPSEEKDKVEEQPSSMKEDVGASSVTHDVIIRGTIHIDGILTRIVVKPDLPEEPVAPQTKKKGAKRRKSTKLLEEEQRLLEEQRKIYEEKVNAAIAAAHEEEEHRMQFAHPDRWSHVVFANMTFEGTVIVSHAHVTFQNCCFAANSPDSTQLLVAQYCKVECVRCTFERPRKCALYGFPMAELKLQKCLFTGSMQTFSNENENVDSAREKRPDAVGLHTDKCKVQLEGCRFKDLGTGIIFRGTFPTGNSENPVMVVKKCEVKNIFGTGVVLDNVRKVEIVHCKFEDCGYYALDCVKGQSIHVFQNAFSSEVRVQSKAQVRFLHNKTATVPLSLKEVENPNLEPIY
ncbi:uncharacterized protein TM35_000015800 [Trypanosoma theileri]|uniref:Right handed beta helix domain-containing protein n=1 Tax=Trypanosoma theileri TaxID=67003 RepID=A0A1X0PAQ0_9TRYP|nr:uncharacterized protein TM35_000015800 [Trypanosoma theileri]ORC93703.1 hypothetical protein TM35_000015800 [Trypanosoma theileri]